MATNPQGYYVITPLYREDGSLVFVNRGWVPKSMEACKWSRPEGHVNVVAVLIGGETKQKFSPDNSEVIKAQQLLWLEVPALLAASIYLHQMFQQVVTCVP